MPRSLAGRTALLLITITVLSLLVLSVAVERNQKQNLLQEKRAILAQTTDEAARLLTRRVSLSLDDVRFLASTPSVRSLVRKLVDPEASTALAQTDRYPVTELLRSYGQQHPEYFQLRVLDRWGRESIRVERHGATLRAVPIAQLQDKHQRPYFAEAIALSAGHTYLSPIDLNREHGQIERPYRPTLRVASPVAGDGRETLGVVVLNLDLGVLIGAIPRTDHGAGFEHYLTNGAGDYLVHPDPQMTFGFDRGARHRIQDDFPSLAELLHHGTSAKSLTLDTSTGPRLFSVRILSLAPEHPQHLALMASSVPVAAVTAALQQTILFNRLLFIAAGVLTLAVVLSALRRITRPLRQLTDAAEHIASGDYQARFENTGTREIDTLIDTLRFMASEVAVRESELQQFNQQLEARVERRTAALQASRHAVLEREAGLNQALRIAKLGSWDWSPASATLNCSLQTRNILGIPSDVPMTRARFLEHIHPDDRNTVVRLFEEGLEPGASVETDYRVQQPNGGERMVHGEAQRSDDPREDRLYATIQDVTEQRRAQERLRLIAGVFSHSLEGILITDRDNRIVEVNSAFTTITGYQPHEVLGNTPAMLSSGWHDRTFYTELWQTLREQGFWQGEVRDRRKNGELYTEWLSISVVRDDRDEVVNHIGIFYDITEKKEAEEHIARLAYFDALTELANRRLFEDRLEQALRQAQRQQHPVTIMFIDLDRFKPVNDSLGHKAGDLLLQGVAKRLQRLVRECDTVARLGGDEFAIILEEADQRRAGDLAATLIKALNQAFDIDANEVFISASVGISVYPEDGTNSATLLKHADIAMYRAKEQGRDTYQFFLPDMTADANERLTLENALRYALERDELSVYYQPQVALTDGRVLGVEALLRWTHPQLGNISPIRFIPIAEESGLIVELGDWVLEQACAQRAQWRGLVADDFSIAVNLSPRQIRCDITTRVRELLTRYGLQQRQLELEVTESMLMADLEQGKALLHQLDQIGLKLAMDDFGTGYSSLSYLKQFPLHKLKVDREFVRDLPNDPEDAAIATAIIAMGHSLGMTVIAEGVEHDAQLQFLKALGCEQFQGYLCSAPVPPGELKGLLQAGHWPH